MPNKKKKFIHKNSATKFVLLRGQSNAVNADGETLPTENILVPVPKNYKSGNSLLLAGLPTFCDSSSDDLPPAFPTSSKEPDLEKILQDFDSDSSADELELHSKLEKLNFQSSHHHSNDRVQIFQEDSDSSEVSDQLYDEVDDFCNSSSKVKRVDVPPSCPETIKLLNARFDKLYEEEYEDDQIGALDDKDITGLKTIDSEQIKNIMNPACKTSDKGLELVLEKCDDELKEKILRYSESEIPEKVVEIYIEKPTEWDCESILSTYSNIYNHPAIIKTEHKIKKIKVPSNPLKKKLTKSVLKQLDSESESEEEMDRISVSTNCINIRPKGETPEQRKERKNMVKEEKREIRKLKKENKLAFMHEKKIQVAQYINTKNNMGIKLL